MSRLEPKNKEQAFCYQFEDTVKTLSSFAALGNKKSFSRQLHLLKSQIKEYEKSINKPQHP